MTWRARIYLFGDKASAGTLTPEGDRKYYNSVEAAGIIHARARRYSRG